MAKPKIKFVDKSVSYEEIAAMNRAHTANAVVIKGTDALIFLDDNDPFIYSKKAYMRGSEAVSRDFRNFMRAKGYGNNYGLYNAHDFSYAMSSLEKETFNKTDHIITKKLLLDGYKSWHETKKKQTHPEYGVELELESDSVMSSASKNEMKAVGGKLVYDVGSDCSVKGGTEIRFNHPAMSGWKYREVANLLTFCKSKGAKTDAGTAGMHIHISRPDVKKIVDRFRDNLATMQEILYPINCRKLNLADGRPMYYGVRDNIYRDQVCDFGTLEIRAWNATLDPKLFLARIKFCKTFTEWLSKTTTVSVQSFFDYMSAKEKANYKYMLNHKENPHEWGFPPKAVNALLAA